MVFQKQNIRVHHIARSLSYYFHTYWHCSLKTRGVILLHVFYNHYQLSQHVFLNMLQQFILKEIFHILITHKRVIFFILQFHFENWKVIQIFSDFAKKVVYFCGLKEFDVSYCRFNLYCCASTQRDTSGSYVCRLHVLEGCRYHGLSTRQYLPNRCSRQGSQLYNNFLLQLVQFYLTTLVIWRAAHGVRKY